MKLHGCVLSALTAAAFFVTARAAAQDKPVGIEALGSPAASSQPTTKPVRYSLSRPVLYPQTSPATGPATAPAGDLVEPDAGVPATAPASESAQTTSESAASEPAGEAATQADQASQPTQYETPMYYRTMIQELSIKGAQEKRLDGKVQAMLQAVDKFDSENADSIRGLQQGLVQAHKDSDLKLQNELLSQLEQLSKQRKEMLDKHDAAILAVLTARQRSAWDAYLLYAQAIKPLLGLEDDPKLALTDDQITKLHNLAARRALKLVAVRGDLAKTSKQYEDMFGYIRQHILTAQQRAKLDEAGSSTKTSASTRSSSSTKAAQE